MNVVRCQVARWVSSKPIPGVVEARLTDIHGKTWLFRDKAPVFSTHPLTAKTALPVTGELRCEVIERGEQGEQRGRTIVSIRTLDVDSDGHDRFDVDAADVLTVDDRP
ncbi:MAG: hypothetical protein M3P38_10280 [Chloroflexota bacterium]|nr:hypothetical protein [Chloroflexota bacterium]